MDELVNITVCLSAQIGHVIAVVAAVFLVLPVEHAQGTKRHVVLPVAIVHIIASSILDNTTIRVVLLNGIRTLAVVTVLDLTL